MSKTDLKSNKVRIIILGLTIVLLAIFLTIEIKLVYDSYIDRFSTDLSAKEHIDQKGLDKILNKYK